MFSRITGYFLLYTISFGFFTAIFHTLAFANILEKEPVKMAEQIEPTFVPEPTPTIYFAPVKGPTPIPIKSGADFSNKSNDLTVTFTITPTVTISQVKPTQAEIILPTSTPIPTTALKMTDAPLPTNVIIHQKDAGGMSADRLFDMANTHRKSLGLGELQRDDKTCALAAARAGEIKAELENGTLHSGMYGRNLPYWNTENAIAMGPEEAAFAWWLSDYIHRKAIENPSYTISCTACQGVYCVQEFTSYQPK